MDDLEGKNPYFWKHPIFVPPHLVPKNKTSRMHDTSTTSTTPTTMSPGQIVGEPLQNLFQRQKKQQEISVATNS